MYICIIYIYTHGISTKITEHGDVNMEIQWNVPDFHRPFLQMVITFIITLFWRTVHMSTGQCWFTPYSVVHSNIWLFLKIWYHIPSVCIMWYTDPNLIVLIGMFTYAAFRGKWDDSFRTHSRHSHIEPWFPGHKSMGCAPNDVTSSKKNDRW